MGSVELFAGSLTSFGMTSMVAGPMSFAPLPYSTRGCHAFYEVKGNAVSTGCKGQCPLPGAGAEPQKRTPKAGKKEVPRAGEIERNPRRPSILLPAHAGERSESAKRLCAYPTSAPKKRCAVFGEGKAGIYKSKGRREL